MDKSAEKYTFKFIDKFVDNYTIKLADKSVEEYTIKISDKYAFSMHWFLWIYSVSSLSLRENWWLECVIRINVVASYPFNNWSWWLW